MKSTLTVCVNENAWAFTYLPRSPIVQSFYLLWIERHTQINYVMSRDVMISYRDVMPSYCRVTWSHTTGHNDFTLEFPSGKSLEITFADVVTLPFDLRPWPTIPILVRSSSTPLPKIKVIGQTVRPRECTQTHTHTHTERQTETRLRFYDLDRGR